MLTTFEPDFDFHFPEGGRPRFAEFASALSERFGTAPQILDDPIFSYKRLGRAQLDRLRELDESRPAIVYLSNIVMHAAVLVLRDCNVSGLLSPLRYDSVESFMSAPHCRGFWFGGKQKVTTGFDATTIVISDLARFRNMDDDQLPDDGLVRVLHCIDDVLVCNILDYDRYFAHLAVFGDQTVLPTCRLQCEFSRMHHTTAPGYAS